MKFIKYLGFLCVISSVFSCQKNAYVALHDVERGLFLDRAYTVSTNTFFQRRLENDITSKKEWLVVNQDIDYVYFGNRVNNKSYVMVAPFYKTEKDKLEKIFPGYASIDGKLIKTTVFENFIKPIIQERLVPMCPQSLSVDYARKKYTLTNNGIESDIKFTGKCYEDKIFTSEVKLILSPEDLHTIEKDINIQ